MLTGASAKLDERIVLLLSVHPGSNARQLHRLLSRGNRSCSLQAVYQELRKLSRQGVVTKVGKSFMLRLAWVLEMSALSQTMFSSLLARGSIESFLPPPGSSRTWRFNNLRAVVTFWTQIALILCELSPNRVYFEWAPHAWFHLVNSEMEGQFLQAMKRTGNRYYLMIGNDTWLDRSYFPLLKNVVGEVSFAEGPFHSRQDRYYSLIGDYLITVAIEQRAVREIDTLFYKVKSADDIDIGTVAQMLGKSARITLKISSGGTACSRMRRKFADYFGIPVVAA